MVRPSRDGHMTFSTRLAVVLWSAVPGLVVGVLAGGALWVAFSLVRLWVVPGSALLDRIAPAVTVACIAIAVAATLVGAAEGWLKQR